MTLVEAAKQLHQRGVDFQLQIIGQGQLRQSLESSIDEGRLRGRVRLLGALRQDDVLDRFKAAHLYVLPCVVAPNGNRAGLPVSIIEALACGLPVVSSPVTAIPEAVQHDYNGLLLPEHDATGLADAIESLIANQDLYRRLAANARSSVLSKFDIRDQAASLAAVM